MVSPRQFVVLCFVMACSPTAGSGVEVDGGYVSPGGDFGGDHSESPAVFTGSVYFIPDTTTAFPNVSSLPLQGTLFVPVLDIPPQDWKTSIAGDRFEWFAIRYTGTFNAAVAGDYAFRLLSDDGSNLYVDGTIVVQNDGLHGPNEATGTVTLSAGQHTIQVDYFQGPRYLVALQVWMTPPGGSEDLFRPAAPM